MLNVWYTARGAGLSALVLLTISTALGALVSRHGPGAPNARPERRYIMQYLHRAFAGLGLAALALHLGAILADSYAHVGWLGALVPFTSAYRPTAVAFGTLAVLTFIGVSVLGLARGRMASTPRGARIWRGLHGLAYLGWASAMMHGFTAGTDSSVGWVRQLYLGCFAAVAGSIAVRALSRKPEPATDRFAARTSALTQGALR
jgi:multisubunit Na+/H+ antiporter MnhB subunit